MTLLILDTCTERMIVGVRQTSPNHDRWNSTDTRGQEGPANHARDLLPAVEKLLQGTRPDGIGVALGPGSFTGVRIGLSTAKGLAEGWQIPLLALDNLRAMADAWVRLNPFSPAAVLAVIDARKGKYYGALFHEGQELLAAGDYSAAEWVSRIQHVWPGPVALSGYQGSHLAGQLEALPNGWTAFDTLDWAPGLLDLAEQEWRAGRHLPPAVAPRYLRLSEAEENLRSRST